MKVWGIVFNILPPLPLYRLVAEVPRYDSFGLLLLKHMAIPQLKQIVLATY